MKENPLYESHNVACPIQASIKGNPLYESHNVACPIEACTSVEENKISQPNQMKNILPNTICSKEKFIKAMISITFVLLLVCIGLIWFSVLTKSPRDNSSQQNKINNDDLLIIQEIKRKKKNGPCTFMIERQIVIKYHISSWVLNDADGDYNDGQCYEYDLNAGLNAKIHQYIHVTPWRCGSICDNTSQTFNNTIHLKVKNDRKISVPISCKLVWTELGYTPHCSKFKK